MLWLQNNRAIFFSRFLKLNLKILNCDFGLQYNKGGKELTGQKLQGHRRHQKQFFFCWN